MNDRGSVGGRDDNLFHPFVVLFFIPLFLIDFVCLRRSALILVTLYQRKNANSAKNNACARLSKSTSKRIKCQSLIVTLKQQKLLQKILNHFKSTNLQNLLYPYITNIPSYIVYMAYIYLIRRPSL